MYHHTNVNCRCLKRTDGLADRIRIVGDLEVREMLADFLGHLFWGEAHGGNVVGTQGELALWCLHELDRGTVAVGDMHHGKTCFRTQVALMVTCAKSVVEDLNCIVCEDRGSGGLVHEIKAGCTKSMWHTQTASDAVPVVPPPGVVLTDMTPG